MTRNTPDRFSEIADALAIEGDDELETLLEASKADPEPGFDMEVYDDFQRPLGLIGPGKWMDHADRETRLPPMCPVIPLGKAGETYFLLNVMGQIETLKSSSSGKGPIGSIFAGRSRYLEWAWPRFGKARKGEPPPVTGWEADDARQALMDACAYVGPFQDEGTVRGRGAWTDHDGRLIYHAGDRVLFRGKNMAPGRLGDWVFPSRPRLPRPWPQPVEGGSQGPADELLEILNTWNWRRPDIDARLLLGWACMAMISGALAWRPAVFITGEKGSGKSTLMEVLTWILGKALHKSVNTTGPAIYQKLGHDCTPIAVDELESQADNNMQRVVQIIELIRTASSGGTINRGSSEGISREYQCKSAFLCSSINIPPMRGQDQSRFAILQLQPFPELAPGEQPVDPSFDADAVLAAGRQLLRRMVDGWSRWPATLKAFRHELMRAGHDARGADQFGGLLAAEHIGRSDEPPTAAELAFWAGALKPTTLAETAHKTEDWRDCLHHLMDVAPEALKHRKGGANTIGGVLNLFRTKDTELDAEEACAQVGLALSWGKGEAKTWENARLFIPGSHPEVRKLYAGTTWAGLAGATGVWANTLQRAPGDLVSPGVCGKGLDRKRWGLFVRLAAAFPALEGDEEA